MVLLTGKEMEMRQRNDEKLRVLETVINRLARVLGTICVGYEPSRRVNRKAPKVPKARCTPPTRLLDTRGGINAEYCALSEGNSAYELPPLRGSDLVRRYTDILISKCGRNE